MNYFTLISSLLIALALLLPSIYASPLLPDSSHTPLEDPMPARTAQLYLVEAGRAPYRNAPVALSAYLTADICPSYHDNGFSVRCVADTEDSVFFRVDEKRFRTEKRAPFLLNGDRNGKVYPFRGLDDGRKVRVSCRVRGERAVWVDLVKKC